MIQINKQLQRPDKGTLASGSLINYTAKFLQDDLTIVYDLTHWFNQAAKDDPQWLPVAKITNFEYRLSRVCTAEEWALLDDSGAPLQVEEWLEEIIDGKIGDGFTEIV